MGEFVGDIQEFAEASGEMELARRATRNCRLPIQRVAQLRAQLIHLHAGFGQQPAHRAAVLLDQGRHQVDGLDELMFTAHCQRLGVSQSELKLAR